jgi:hypothetical protein
MVSGMKQIRYALYPPAASGLPWLAVALRGYKPIDIFGSPSQDTTERVLVAMRARLDAKRDMAHA